jgi:hypothetical protein
MDSASPKFHQLLAANRILFFTLKPHEVMRHTAGVVEAAISSLLLYDDHTDSLLSRPARVRPSPFFSKESMLKKCER